jgi:hypothetical protein
MVGGRALGTVDFDPVTALLTVHLLIFSVLLLPVEQFEIRRVTLDRTGGAGAIGAVIVFGAVGAVVFTLLTRNHFFAGETGYAVIAGVAVACNALLAVARGRLAGHRRFRAYGLVSGIVAMARSGVGFPGGGTQRADVRWALAVAPVLTLPGTVRREGPVAVLGGGAGRPLGGFVVAARQAKLLLLAARSQCASRRHR